MTEKPHLIKKPKTTVTIVDTTIPIIEYEGHRVIRFVDIDRLHQRPEGTARKRFADNKDRFVEGKHFYLVDSSQKSVFRTFNIEIPARGLTLITERGYSLLVKSFNDDFAWEVQDQLVDGYFDAKKPMSTAEFLVEQANLILEHDQKIKEIQRRQADQEAYIAETKQEVKQVTKKAEEAFEAAAAALQHKFGERDYYSILAFCSAHNIKLGQGEAKIRGAQASKLSREKDKKIIKIPDERYGKVGSYHIDILRKVFSDKLRSLTPDK